MTIRKLVGKVHLFLGFTSGVMIMFLGITGCILAFEIEIRNLTESYQFINTEKRSYLPPSLLRTEAEKYLKGKSIAGIEYRASGKSAVASYYDGNNYVMIYLNPYSGKMLKVKDMNHDFFRSVLLGHYYLWLTPSIGQPIVASATLIFLVMMISGLILWWPRKKGAAKQRFIIKWNARWRRRNYDLHNVLAFYMTWVAVFLALSGLVMGFQWFAKSVYWLSAGGKTASQRTYPVSDTSVTTGIVKNAADKIWMELLIKKGEKESLGIFYPYSKSATISGNLNHVPGTFYNTDYHQFDQYTTVEIKATGINAGKFNETTLANKISRMNYDIHVGAVLGLPGKMLAFCGSLIAASLPVTGFLIWLGRRKKTFAGSQHLSV